MGIEIVIENKISESLKKIDGEFRKRMLEAVQLVQKKAHDILSGPRSGRRYRVPGTKGTYYTASSGETTPAEPPAQATGKLRESVEWATEQDGMVGLVGTKLEYGPMLEFGTHGGAVITPKTAKVLAFDVDGKTIFTKRVIQGRIKPRPWLRVAFEKSEDRVKLIFSREIT